MNPIWRKAPLLLLRRYPKMAGAVFGASLLLGLASVAGPLFVSASGSAAVADQIEGQPPLFAGFRIGRFGPFNDPAARATFEENGRLLDRTVGRRDHLGDPVVTLLGPNADATSPEGDDATPVRLISRSGASDHVEIVDGDASGVLLADTAAEELGGIGPGDHIRFQGLTTQLEVSGIYEELASAAFDPYWTNLGGLIFPDANGVTPPPFVLLDQDTMFEIAGPLELSGNYFWEFPLEGTFTLPEAQNLANYMTVFDRGVNDDEEIAGDPERRVVEAFDQGGQVVAQFPRLVANAQDTVTALEGPVLVLSLAGRLVALAVMAAAGAYLVVARKTEIQLLTARGMTPLQQGTRSVLEATLPSLSGVVAGAAAGYALVLGVGPSDTIASTDVSGAALQTLITLVIGLAVAGTAAALGVRASTLSVDHRKKANLWRFPWEVPVLVLAGASFYEITTRDSIIIEGADGDRIDVFVLLFPILFLLGGAGIIGRGLKFIFGKLRFFGTERSSATYLASRRLAAAPGSVIGLLVAAVLSIGILIYAQSLAQTIRSSTEAKAGVFVGSDVQLLVYATTELPDDFGRPATKVRKIPVTLTNNVPTHVMGIDTGSFPRAAFWDNSFADRPLDELLQLLSEHEGDALPVIVASGDGRLDSGPAIDLATDIPLNIVAEVRAFPGQVSDEPLLITDMEALRDAFAGVNSAVTANGQDQVWARGTQNEVLQAANDADVPVGTVRSMEQVLARPTLDSVTWAFDLLRALGIAAGAIAFLAVLLYMQARQRSTIVAYAMARRMGLKRRQHSTALMLEIATILAVAVIGGTVLAATVAKLVYGYLDLLPQIPPAPLLRIPATVILAVFALGVLGAIAGAALVQRGADKARIAEVLRLAD